MAQFSVVPLDDIYTHGVADTEVWEDITAESLSRLPRGSQQFWGIPFEFGSDEACLAVIGTADTSLLVVEPVGLATHIVFAHFCDSRSMGGVAGQTTDYPLSLAITSPGELLARYMLVYADGSEEAVPIRRRFEVSHIHAGAWGVGSAYAGRPHLEMQTLPFRGPYPERIWGWYQMGSNIGDMPPALNAPVPGQWTLYAHANPHPGKLIHEIRLEPTSAAAVALGAITLFNGTSSPLRHVRLESVGLAPTSEADPLSANSELNVDLGVLARVRSLRRVNEEDWLGASMRGRGEDPDLARSEIAVDVTAAVDATLNVNGDSIQMKTLYEKGESVSASGAIRASLLGRERTWVHGRIVDKASGQPMAARIHMLAPDGRYLPPYGHRHEVNDHWFEDYGADLKLGETEYAYVDGSFQADLPVGDVYVEAARGFEYEPVRTRLEIESGQREIEIALERKVDERQSGWVSADTHVHFLSPETARLEGEAEELNVINLLAAQWGDLYTNVGDITGDLSKTSTEDVLIWVGTENRNHFLGHISLLGTQGSPVFPMSASGPREAFIGDPTWRSISQWADECHHKGGLVVAPHFPFPHAEVLAAIVTERVDAVEILSFWTESLDTFSFHEYYRLLNCGYRVPVVGGTDKMSAAMPVGNVRTYAHIGGRDLTYSAWMDAVKAGRTYTTSGPLLSFDVDGHVPGDEIMLTGNGGTVNVKVAVQSFTAPIHRVEVVHNGRVVLQESASGDGSHSIELEGEVRLDSSGWIAARCVSEHVAWSVWPQHIAGHTSPVYVDVDGRRQWDRGVTEYLVTTMNGGLLWLDTIATIDTEDAHKAVRNGFVEAIAELERRLQVGQG